MSLFSKDAEIKGKTVLITGGCKNLGAHTATEFAKFGTNLFLHYHSSKDKSAAEAFAKEIASKHGVKVAVYGGDLNTYSQVHALFAAAKKEFPSGVDIAINNIGMVLKKPVADISEEEFDKMDQINNKTAFLFLKEAAREVNTEGKIISLVTSLLAAYTPFYGSYQGTKSGVEYYSKALSKELKDKNISVNCVAPGPMDTPFLYPQEEDGAVEFYKTVTIHNRLTKVEDIVPIIRFLATEGYWITGQTIYASGGFTAH